MGFTACVFRRAMNPTCDNATGGAPEQGQAVQTASGGPRARGIANNAQPVMGDRAFRHFPRDTG